MKRIKEIRIKNFKAFPDEQVFKLGGKNLLLFGENGAGKSSLYWALYTFLQSSGKDDAGVNKYFENYEPNNKDTFQSLLNIHSLHGSAQSFIKLKFDDDSEIELSKNNGANTRIADIKNTNLASDFITYKMLYNFYSSTHKTHLNVWDVFRKDIFPYFSDNQNLSLHDRLEEILNNPPKYEENQGGKFYRRDSWMYKNYQERIHEFNKILIAILGKINQSSNSLLEDEYFNINNIKVLLEYTQKLEWDPDWDRAFSEPCIRFHIKVLRDGAFLDQYRPHSFLNEAVLAQLSLAIRMGALFTRLGQSETKILVLDDLLISLDMDNRDKVLDILLQKTTKSGKTNLFDSFQILFLTHDRGLNYFVGEKIKQHGRKKDWLLQEIYQGTSEEKDNAGNIVKSYPKPILIEGDLDDLEKAKRYLKTNKDYSVCAVYLRKALETIIINRLPKELAYKADGEPKTLHMLWRELVKHYGVLAPNSITPTIRALYNQSRLMLLNPQAHYNHLSLPVYRKELEQVISLVTHISDNCPILEPTILLSSGMHLKFIHPAKPFTYEFLLTSDFVKVVKNGVTRIEKPRCKVLSWQYNNIVFCDVTTGLQMSQKTIDDVTTKEAKFNRIIHHLVKHLGVDKKTLLENISIENSIWTLKEVLEKAKVDL